MAPERLARLGDARPDGRLHVERAGRGALGDQHLVVAETQAAVRVAQEGERGVERRRRAQRDLRGPSDVASDQPAGVAAIRAGRGAVEAAGDEHTARSTDLGERAAPHAAISRSR
jgi:hypothetical protein